MINLFLAFKTPKFDTGWLDIPTYIDNNSFLVGIALTYTEA